MYYETFCFPDFFIGIFFWTSQNEIILLNRAASTAQGVP